VNKKYLETIKSVDGIIYHLQYHQQRLDGVLNSLNLPHSHNLQTMLNPPLKGTYRCRVLYDGLSMKIEYFEYIKREIRTLKLLYDDSVFYEDKYEDRDAINALFLQKGTCDDILIVKDGFITDTSIANLAFYDGLEWVTPKKPLLRGTTRQRLIESGKLVQKEILVSDLKQFRKVALMNAMIDFDIIPLENIGEIIC